MFGENVEVPATDTDSLIVQIKTKGNQSAYNMLASKEIVNCFDFKGKKIIGTFKDEVTNWSFDEKTGKYEINGQVIKRFIGIRPKMYHYDLCDIGRQVNP